MKYLFVYSSLLLTIILSACGQECQTCKLANAEDVEYCDDSDIFYTDMDGELISYEEAITQQEARGYVCD